MTSAKVQVNRAATKAPYINNTLMALQLIFIYFQFIRPIQHGQQHGGSHAAKRPRLVAFRNSLLAYRQGRAKN